MKELTARVEGKIHASSAQVCEAITTPDALKKLFFGASVQPDWKVGSQIRVTGEVSGKR